MSDRGRIPAEVLAREQAAGSKERRTLAGSAARRSSRKGGLRVFERPIWFDYEQPIELPQFRHL